MLWSMSAFQSYSCSLYGWFSLHPSPGPVIKAEAGDVIIVTFFNRATNDYSIQPHGLHYEKTYEGARYQDGKSYTATGTHTRRSSNLGFLNGQRGRIHWKKIKNHCFGDNLIWKLNINECTEYYLTASYTHFITFCYGIKIQSISLSFKS